MALDSVAKANAKVGKDKHKAMVMDFCRNVEPRKILFHCELCSRKQSMWTLRQRNGKYGRFCRDIIDDDKAKLCESDNAPELHREFHRKYTNWDQCYEFTSEWELQYMVWLPGWFNKLNIHCNSTTQQLNAASQQIKEMETKVKYLNKIKTHFFKSKCGIKNINDYVLNCFLRRLDYYKSIINYYGKLNNYIFFRDYQIPEYGICDACGLKVYLKTQYERIYICWSARKFMHQMEYIKEENETFVCQWCIGKAISRANDKYSELTSTSLMFDTSWENVDYLSQVWFALAHLDNKRLPIHICYYDINACCWRRG